MPVKDIFRHYRNEKLKAFFESLSEDERVVAHKTLQFFRETFPECENALRGELIHEEVS
jgi:hypothetical protein